MQEGEFGSGKKHITSDKKSCLNGQDLHSLPYIIRDCPTPSGLYKAIKAKKDAGVAGATTNPIKVQSNTGCN